MNLVAVRREIEWKQVFPDPGADCVKVIAWRTNYTVTNLIQFSTGTRVGKMDEYPNYEYEFRGLSPDQLVDVSDGRVPNVRLLISCL